MAASVLLIASVAFPPPISTPGGSWPISTMSIGAGGGVGLRSYASYCGVPRDGPGGPLAGAGPSTRLRWTCAGVSVESSTRSDRPFTWTSLRLRTAERAVASSGGQHGYGTLVTRQRMEEVSGGHAPGDKEQGLTVKLHKPVPFRPHGLRVEFDPTHQTHLSAYGHSLDMRHRSRFREDTRELFLRNVATGQHGTPDS